MPVVYIAKIDQTFSSFRYLTKYLTKLHRIEWTDRHVSYSKNFFRPEDVEKMAWPARDVLYKTDDHPWKFLADRYEWDPIAAEADGSYTLPTDPLIRTPRTPTRSHIPLSEFGLRIPEASPPSAEPKQEQLFETHDHPF